MKKIQVLLFLIFGCFEVFAQTTVFTDDFSTNQNATYTTTGAIGASVWSVLTGGTVGQDFGARRNTAVAQLELTNDATVAVEQNGWSFASTPTASFTAPYNTRLNLNTGMITWTFNMRQIRIDPSGFAAASSYGVAYILAGDGPNGAAGTVGYAVALGQAGTTDPIRLLKFNNGMQGAIADIIVSNTVGLTDFGAEYLSIKVTYAPATDTWELFIRNDGAIAFADPAAGVLTSQGTAIDNFFTGNILGYMGGYWQGSTATSPAQTAFFDNAKVTVTLAPTINVSPASLSGFTAVSGVNSAEQSYNVDGANLTANIVITPPVGFGISLTPGGPYSFNPAFAILPQTDGIVASTPVYVVMNSATLGVNTGNITHTSMGATPKNVALTGNVLDAEPNVQSTITIGAVTNSTIVVNFGGGNGARRILLAKLAVPVDSNTADGSTYTANANFGSGTQIGTGNYVVYDGIGNTQLVTGLTAGATYHFAVYEYNNGGGSGSENYLVPGGTGNATVLTYAVPYVWIGGNGDWQVATNWLPTRLFPATNDSLLFITPGPNVITNVPTQTVGYIGASLLTNTTLQAATSGNTLTIGNLTGTDLVVEAGAQLNISSANTLALMVTTGATASISGSITFTAGAHKLIAADAGAVTFNNGAVFTAGAGFISNPFGPLGTTANSVIFSSGSRFDQVAGGNPFALIAPASIVVFQTGSLFRMLINQLPSLSGRTYANLEIDVTGFSQSSTGTGLMTVDNLTIIQGVLNINLTGGISIKGNIAVAAGQTLTFTPASLNTLTFNGTTPQTITNAGTLTFAANEAVTFNNANGITINSNVTFNNLVTFTSGVVTVPNPMVITFSAAASATGASNASFVNGKVSKIGNTDFIFPVGKTNCGPSGTKNGYAAISTTNFIGGAPTDQFTAEYIRGSAGALGTITAIGLHHVSACDYWTLDKLAGTPIVDVRLYWQDSINNCTTASPYVNSLPSLVVAHFDGANWNAFGAPGTATPATASGNVTWPSVSVFSPFAIGSIDFNNPLPIKLNYITGQKQNDNHLLNWKITCVSTPSATLELQRSADGSNYNTIYSIVATALRCEQPFDYTDNQPVKGINYYRLKMTSADGKVTYSTIVPLINDTKGTDMMNIAPNPIVGGAFNIKISTAQETNMEFVIADMQGRIVQRRSAKLIAGFNTIPVQVGNLSTGTYQLYGNSADGRTRVLRFVVQ